MTRALMLQGTGSDVGKTVLVAGLCRLAHNRGLKVAPFKPQNMSNNAAVADDGGEIGRGQWLQAFASRQPPSIHMNPVLLKPQSDTGSQVIVQGKMLTNAKARDYQALKKTLFGAVLKSYEYLKTRADLIIVEGAGSPAEINLRASDIANMGFATAVDIPVVMVGDIDRGGVIASLAGTHAILADNDRRMIEGFIINKFRGDPRLFDDGLEAITAFTGWRSYGVVPWLVAAARLPAEDSVVLERLSDTKNISSMKYIKIAVPVSTHIANFDDLDPLFTEDGVEIVLVRSGERLPSDADLILLPGSKSTIADMRLFFAAGWADDICAHARRGGAVIGICGGLQMLGRTISDPHGIEGRADHVEGLGLLNIDTVMAQTKTVRNVTAFSPLYNETLEGYEIHLGQTQGPDCANAVITIDNRCEGAASADGKIWGTYLHGLFQAGSFRRKYLEMLGGVSNGDAYLDSVDQALDTIAADLETYIDIDALFRLAR